MPEFFITARSFAAPFFSDESEAYIAAGTARAALEQFAANYQHPAGLYAAEVWASHRAYLKRDDKPLARYLSNKAVFVEGFKDGTHSFYSAGPDRIEVDGELHTIEKPADGSVVA